MAASAHRRAGHDLKTATLARVPGCEDGEPPLAVRVLRGRSGGRSVLVRTRAGEFVVHEANGTPNAFALDLRREGLLQSIAAAANLAPEVIWSDPGGLLLVTQYVRAPAWLARDMGDVRVLERLGASLLELYRLPAPALLPFDPVATVLRYRAALRKRERSALGADRAVTQVRALASDLAAERRTATIIHGDLHHSNILRRTRPLLIDWEYAQVADPLFDLGCLLAYYPRARQHAERLLASAGFEASATLPSLLRSCELYTHLNALWARIAAREAATPKRL